MGQTDCDHFDGEYRAVDPTTGVEWYEIYECPFCGAPLGEAKLIDAVADDGPIGCDTCGETVHWGEAQTAWVFDE